MLFCAVRLVLDETTLTAVMQVDLAGGTVLVGGGCSMVKAGIMVSASEVQTKASCQAEAAVGGTWPASSEFCRVPLKWCGTSMELPVRLRCSGDSLVVLLHGIGCSSESFNAAFSIASLQGYSICAFDFPGHGRASGVLPDVRLLEADDFLSSYADVARQVIRWVKKRQPRISRVFIVGHSMGGAVGAIVARGSGISGFVNVDGNLVAEDCGIVSRRMAEQSLDEFRQRGYKNFVAELEDSPAADLRVWASWCSLANPVALHRAAQSLVEWSDGGKLLEAFNSMPVRAYLYGGMDDRGYITKRISSVQTTIETIEGSGHFAMIDNPAEFYSVLSAVLGKMGADIAGRPRAGNRHLVRLALRWISRLPAYLSGS